MTSFLRTFAPRSSLTLASLLLAAGCGESAKSPDGGGGQGGASSTGGGASGGVGSSGGSGSSGGAPGAGGATTGGSAATGGSTSTGGGSSARVSCDPAEIVCQPLVPPEPCAEMWAHSVVDGCHGACVPIADCDCTGGRACPDENQYVCWNSAGHCGPYVR